MKECPICGAFQVDTKTFQVSNSDKLWPNDKMKTRVCQYTKKEGCINLEGQLDQQYVHPLLGAKSDDATY